MTSTPIDMLPLPPTDEYRAGACNIGPAEIARRRGSGIAGVAVAAALAVGLVAVGAPDWSRWLVALPLAGGAAGLLQAHLRFCAAYGLAGLRNFGPLGRASSVADDAARRADRRRALQIGLASAAVGLAGAAVLVALPV
ncbi:MAG: hypothetical protein MUC54_07790 [Chloroflexi bacterium]|jgi:hypothetical protein|nr:hypothetical protein [Chloroflexota bacterium]